MATQELTFQRLSRKEADTIASEPRADYNVRLQQLNHNFPSLGKKGSVLLQLVAGYATTEEWRQLEATYQLKAEPTDW